MKMRVGDRRYTYQYYYMCHDSIHGIMTCGQKSLNFCIIRTENHIKTIRYMKETAQQCGFFHKWCRLADPKTSICFLLYNRKNGYFTLFYQFSFIVSNMFSEIFVKTPLKIPLMMLCNWSIRAIYQNNLLIQLCEATSSFPSLSTQTNLLNATAHMRKHLYHINVKLHCA